MDVLNIVDKLARGRVVEDMIKNMNINDYPDDLAQEIYLILLEYDKDKIEDIYNKNQINFFISRIITNQAFSKNSPFYLNYKKWDFNKEDLDFDNDADTEGY
ncbi:MAG: hypothetical protein KIG88_00150 [Weeksellaceae bacterium]|nr:hypothetical protein [Weeksellaceae bacterium]